MTCSGFSKLGDGILPRHGPGAQARAPREHGQQRGGGRGREGGAGRGRGQEARHGGVHRRRPDSVRPRAALQAAAVLQPGVAAAGPLRLAGLVHPRPDVRAGRVLRQVDTRTHNSPDDPVPCVFQVRSPRLLPPPVLPGGPAGEVREAG